MHVHHIISNWPYNVPYFWENLDATLTPWLLASPWVWCRKPSYSVGRELAGSHRAGAHFGPKMGPKWAQNGHLNDIWWDNGDSAMDLVAFPQTNPAESWSMAQRVFSMDRVSSPCLQAGFFSTQRVDILGELTAWIPGFPGAKTSGSRWWSCRSEWQAWLGMALRKGASISWVKLGWLVQIRLVLTNLVTRKPLVHHHVISCPVVFFVHFWGHIKNRSPDQAANQRTAPSSVYIS